MNRLQNKTFKLECQLQLSEEIDVICLTELWLKPKQITCINIMNYSLRAQCCRTICQGGGACIYAKTSLIERKEVAELSVEMHIEACAIECVGLDVIVVCIYRLPKGDTELFFEKLDALLNLNAI